ncbi:MAG TPA: dihydroneopterin aldolase [Chitinophagaceae bacterium]
MKSTIGNQEIQFQNFPIPKFQNLTVVTINLRQLRFFVHHGLYEEERKVSNEFIVDLEVGFDSSATVITKMNETINYIKLYELVKKHMLLTTDLLETLATSITEDIHQSYSQVKKVSISITKKYPPVINFSGNVAVSYVKEF